MISVIVPVFNGESCLGATLSSLAKQSLDELEVVIVDDASEDRSAEVASKWAASDHRFRVVKLPSNRGVHEARAAGLRRATGDWIGFLDADDFPRPNMFSTLLRSGVDSKVDVVVCGSDLVSTRREVLEPKVRFPRNEVVETDLLQGFCSLRFGTGALWNKIFRRELILKHGLRQFRWRQDATEDTLVNIGCFRDATRIGIVAEQLHEYVRHDASATAAAGKAKGFARIIRAFAEALHQYGGNSEDAEAIVELYARQFNFQAYRIRGTHELSAHRELFEEPLQFLAAEFPVELASLLSRGYVPTPVRQTFGTRVKRRLGRWIPGGRPSS